jgi:hypothetical protein
LRSDRCKSSWICIRRWTFPNASLGEEVWGEEVAITGRRELKEDEQTEEE